MYIELSNDWWDLPLLRPSTVTVRLQRKCCWLYRSTGKHNYFLVLYDKLLDICFKIYIWYLLIYNNLYRRRYLQFLRDTFARTLTASSRSIKVLLYLLCFLPYFYLFVHGNFIECRPVSTGLLYLCQRSFYHRGNLNLNIQCNPSLKKNSNTKVCY